MISTKSRAYDYDGYWKPFSYREKLPLHSSQSSGPASQNSRFFFFEVRFLLMLDIESKLHKASSLQLERPLSSYPVHSSGLALEIGAVISALPLWGPAHPYHSNRSLCQRFSIFGRQRTPYPSLVS